MDVRMHVFTGRVTHMCMHVSKVACMYDLYVSMYA